MLSGLKQGSFSTSGSWRIQRVPLHLQTISPWSPRRPPGPFYYPTIIARKPCELSSWTRPSLAVSSPSSNSNTVTSSCLHFRLFSSRGQKSLHDSPTGFPGKSRVSVCVCVCVCMSAFRTPHARHIPPSRVNRARKLQAPFTLPQCPCKTVGTMWPLLGFEPFALAVCVSVSGTVVLVLM